MDMILKNASRSTLRVSVPITTDIIENITDRSNGELVLNRVIVFQDNTESTESEVFRANYQILSYNKGARNSSGTVEATKQFTNNEPTKRTVQKIINETSDTSGKRNWTVALSDQFLAGDIAVIEEEEVILDQVSLTIGPQGATMALKEV